MAKKVIFDTDVGLDDAVALFTLLRAHREKLIQLVAITAVQGNTGVDNVVTNIYRTLHVVNMSEVKAVLRFESNYNQYFQQDIPVYKGAHASLVEPYVHLNPSHGWDGFGDISHEFEPNLALLQKEHAVNALLTLVNGYPGEITIVAVGPLTNIAMAMRMDPNFSKNINELFIMGGNTEGVGNITVSAEFNFHCDPEAAYIVLRNVECKTFIVAWELCLRRAELPWDWRKNVFGKLGTPEVELLNRIENRKLQEKPAYSTWVVCDQVPAAAVIDPMLITESSTHYAMVELQGKLTRGQMVVDYGSKMKQTPNVILVDRIDLKRLKQLLLWGVGAQIDITRHA